MANDIHHLVQTMSGTTLKMSSPDSDIITSAEDLLQVLSQCWDTPLAAAAQKVQLADQGRRALQAVARCAQETFDRVDPDLSSLRWSAPILRKENKDDPMRLRLAIIARDMDELCLVGKVKEDRTSEEVLNLASDLFRYCSGVPATAEYDNGLSIDLQPVSWNSAAAEAAMFECVVLILCELARHHSRWYHNHCSLSIVLWNQIVPGTGGLPFHHSLKYSRNLKSYKADKAIYRQATNGEQVQHYQKLAAAFVVLNNRPSPQSSYDLITYCEEAMKLIISACSAVVPDSAIPGTKTFGYVEQMLTFARFGVSKIVKVIDAFYGPSADPPSRFQPSSVQRARPLINNSTVIREWSILEQLDALYRQDPLDLGSLYQNFMGVIARSDGAQHEFGLFPSHAQNNSTDYADLVDMKGPVEIVRLPVFNNANTQWSNERGLAWRNDMRTYARQAVIGVAQCVSRAFKGEEVAVWDQNVSSR